MQVWFLTAVAGQWVFLAYLFVYYVNPAIREGIASWSKTDLTTGYIQGDAPGNTAIAMHIFLAVIIFGVGPLQFLPQIRRKYASVHRWSGRVYLIAAVLASLAGFYMVWVRGNPQAGAVEHAGTTIGGLLIIAFSVLTINFAVKRNFSAHRRWAMRLFLVASGTWFIRLGYGFWFFFYEDGGKSFSAFSAFISFAQYLIPLAVLELYFRAEIRSQDLIRTGMGLLLITLAFFTAFGIYQAAAILWLPRLY